MSTVPMSIDPRAQGAASPAGPPTADDILRAAEGLRWNIGGGFHEQLMEDIYTDAARLADRSVTRPGEQPRFDLDRAIDRVVTSRRWGFPLMILLFAIVFWITIVGANIPSRWLSFVLIDTVYPWLHTAAAAVGLPWWLSGLLIDGMYLATAWVVSVMLPPMASSSPCSRCWRTSAICRAWPSTSTTPSSAPARTAGRR